ncbi:hypothetical protein OG302_10015 [Streptomyces sp. NBC_01283]|uniref:hypothetical protein n=1 Tax=Streptomyces sp. NBC_01283 TaxID=2903812 RepID=UPI00352CE6AE|nr:hypothetical protein OG302_10015 [Streptomyces sp. NBC_01283]
MSEHFEQDFATSAQRRRAWGGALLGAAGLIWLVLAYQLIAPFSEGDDSSGSRKCQSMLFYEDEGDDAPTWADATWDDCRAERRWPEMLGWLGLSVPLSVGGAVLYTSGATSLRMREYMAEHRIAARVAAEKDAARAEKDAARKD